MRMIFKFMRDATREEWRQLLLIFASSLVAAWMGFTAVSWLPKAEMGIGVIWVLATAVTLIFCGTMRLYLAFLLPNEPFKLSAQARQPSASASPKTAVAQMDPS